MPLLRGRAHTSEDYWNLPDGQHAELIGGQLYSRLAKKVSAWPCPHPWIQCLEIPR